MREWLPECQFERAHLKRFRHGGRRNSAFLYRIFFPFVKAKWAYFLFRKLSHFTDAGIAMSLYSLEGASGRCYDYILLNQKTRAAIPMGGGNFLFARPLGNGLEIICAGETESIWNVFVSTALWDTAKNKHGATLAYVHLNADHSERQLETADLINKYRPPMNVERPAEAEMRACDTSVA